MPAPSHCVCRYNNGEGQNYYEPYRGNSFASHGWVYTGHNTNSRVAFYENSAGEMGYSQSATDAKATRSIAQGLPQGGALGQPHRVTARAAGLVARIMGPGSITACGITMPLNTFARTVPVALAGVHRLNVSPALAAATNPLYDALLPSPSSPLPPPSPAPLSPPHSGVKMDYYYTTGA